jgi:hypothetical protein
MQLGEALMMRRQLIPLVALCGTFALTAWGTASLGVFGSSGFENSAIAAISVGQAADPDLPDTGFVLAGVSTTAVPALEAASPDAPATAQPETRMQLVSLGALREMKEYPKPAVRPLETADECRLADSLADICIDEYLWSLYQRTPKVDTNKLTEKIKTTVTKNGKTRTVVKTVIKYVLGDFTWKDPIAAKRVDMPLKEYVIGGMDRGFKLKLYHALRKMDAAGLMPGITSAFRDDYRQSIASGNKAASDSSYHGGSRRGGYGRGLAADLVSVKGETRMERFASSEQLWRWIDANEKELGIGRPYRDRDPPHVAPIDGKEYAVKRGLVKAVLAKAALAKAGVAKADVAKADVAKAGLAKTEVAKTGVAKTGVAKTDLAKTDVAKTGVAKTDFVKAQSPD